MAENDGSLDSTRVTLDDVMDEVALEMPTAGMCLECRRLVRRASDGRCPEGHHPSSVVGTLSLKDDRELPQLARFNWGAFLMPMVWGPAHGLWVGAVLFPVWLFADSIVMSAYRTGGLLWVAAAAVVAATIGFMAWFATTASIPAYLRVSHKVSIPRFNRRQRVWAAMGAVFMLAVLALATYYNVFLYDSVKGAV